MNNLLNNTPDLKTMSPLTLAFIGDGVYELLVREFIVGKGNCPVKKLHSAKVELVRCEFQAAMGKDVLFPMFTEEEKEVYLRGRNAHVGHVPKNACVADYHGATALEAIFGYLYLKGDIDRLRVFFTAILDHLTGA